MIQQETAGISSRRAKPHRGQVTIDSVLIGAVLKQGPRNSGMRRRFRHSRNEPEHAAADALSAQGIDSQRGAPNEPGAPLHQCVVNYGLGRFLKVTVLFVPATVVTRLSPANSRYPWGARFWSIT